MWDVVLDALLDTLKLFPFLLLLYILIELMEHNTGVGRPRRALAGKGAPALGAALGVVPMCGFSVMAAKLYEHRHLTVGTLLAVFITTSDEGVLVLLLSDFDWQRKLISVAALIGTKLVLALVTGYLAELLFRTEPAPLPADHHFHHDHHDHKEGDHVRGHAHENVHEAADGEPHGDHEHGDCECAELSPCEHKHENKWMVYLVSPLLHALEVAAFVLLVNLAFGLLFYLVGDEKVLGFLQGSGYWAQPAVCALIGLIPNCASSVVIAEAYALGGIGFGGLLAGLTTGAGLGYLVLFKKGTRKRGAAVVGFMLLLGIAAGYAAGAVMQAL